MPCFHCGKKHRTDDDDIDVEREIPNLHTIYRSDPTSNLHKVMLDEWRTEFELSQRNLARKEARESSSRQDLYQILGLYFVFQGVVVTAVSQSDKLKCSNWYLPFCLSLLVSIAAFFASVQKLKEITTCSKEVHLQHALYKAIKKSLDNLKDEGTNFDIKNGLPVITTRYDNDDKKGIWEKWIYSYSGAVLLLLILFSALTLFSVKWMLCNS